MNVEKMSITLPADMAALIRSRVESGSYATNSEVIREALRMWQDKELEREERLQSIRESLDAAAADPVRLTPQQVRARLDRLHKEALEKERAS